MKKSWLLLVSAILSTLYLIYIVSYFFGGLDSANEAEAIGQGLATALVAPHMFVLFVAVIFNWIGWAAKATWGALTGGILYCVSAFLFLLYSPFLILQIIFSFIGYAKMKKEKKIANSESE